jgi:hypothetical protein
MAKPGLLAHPQAAARPFGSRTAEGEQAFARGAAAASVAGAAPVPAVPEIVAHCRW